MVWKIKNTYLFIGAITLGDTQKDWKEPLRISVLFLNLWETAVRIIDVIN